MVSMYFFIISGRYVWGFHQKLIHHCYSNSCLIFCMCGFSRILVPIQEYILPCQWAGTPTLHTVDQVCPIFPGRFRGDRSTPADYLVNTRHLYLPQGFIHFCSCVWTNECETVGYSPIADAKKIYSKMCGAKYWGRCWRGRSWIRGSKFRGMSPSSWPENPRVPEAATLLQCKNPSICSHRGHSSSAYECPFARHGSSNIKEKIQRGFYASAQSDVVKNFRPALMAWPWDA